MHSIIFVENIAYQHMHLILALKHGGGIVILWACFAATGPCSHSSVYQSILDSHVKPPL